jgi:hypothetical protein
LCSLIKYNAAEYLATLDLPPGIFSIILLNLNTNLSNGEYAVFCSWESSDTFLRGLPFSSITPSL